MTGITTHILDATLGKPATGVTVKLFLVKEDNRTLLVQKQTDADGRIKDFNIEQTGQFVVGDYQLVFEVKPYFEQAQRDSFYPKVCIDFSVTDTSQHYHVPLLISPFSYSTYRGS